MTQGKYAKYVFEGLKSISRFTTPQREGKSLFSFHWSEEAGVWFPGSKIWVEVNLHYAPGGVFCGGQERVETEGEKAGQVIGISVPHRHPVDEAFFFFGTNPKDPHSLQGEIEFWLGLGEDAEKFTFTKNTCVYVPAGLGHLPTRATRVDNPAQPIVMLVIHTASNWIIEEALDDKGEPIYPPGWIVEKR